MLSVQWPHVRETVQVHQVYITIDYVCACACFLSILIVGFNAAPRHKQLPQTLERVPVGIVFCHLFKANCSNRYNVLICWALLIAVQSTTFKVFVVISKHNVTVSWCGLTAGHLLIDWVRKERFADEQGNDCVTITWIPKGYSVIQPSKLYTSILIYLFLMPFSCVWWRSIVQLINTWLAHLISPVWSHAVLHERIKQYRFSWVRY